MAYHFTANQYEKQFDSKILQNWEVPKTHRENPKALDGFTQIIATDRGHLMDGVPRKSQTPWGPFVGTWDMPKKIPGGKITNPTARSYISQLKLKQTKQEGDHILSGKMKNMKVSKGKLSPVPAMPSAKDVEGGTRYEESAEARAAFLGQEPVAPVKVESPAAGARSPGAGTPGDRSPTSQKASPPATPVGGTPLKPMTPPRSAVTPQRAAQSPEVLRFEPTRMTPVMNTPQPAELSNDPANPGVYQFNF